MGWVDSETQVLGLKQDVNMKSMGDNWSYCKDRKGKNKQPHNSAFESDVECCSEG